MRIVVTRGATMTKAGQEYTYAKSRLLRKKVKSGNINIEKYYSELSFEYTFTKASDKLYFSYCYPYTFSTLLTFLKSVELQLKRPR